MATAWLRDLRGAVFRGEAAEVVALAGRAMDAGALQLLGDGLLAATAQGVDGAQALARRVAGELRGRGWPGDELLADEIDGMPTELEATVVRLDDLAADIDDAEAIASDMATFAERSSRDATEAAAADLRAFLDGLEPDEADAFQVLAAERRRGRARAWLASTGHRPAVRTEPFGR